MNELVPEALRSFVPTLLAVYAVIINAVSAVVCITDKINAKKHRSRVPEAALMWLSVFGGALFMLITMLLIRHKTRKPKFMIGIPVILLIQLGAVLFFCL